MSLGSNISSCTYIDTHTHTKASMCTYAYTYTLSNRYSLWLGLPSFPPSGSETHRGEHHLPFNQRLHRSVYRRNILTAPILFLSCVCVRLYVREHSPLSPYPLSLYPSLSKSVCPSRCDMFIQLSLLISLLIISFSLFISLFPYSCCNLYNPFRYHRRRSVRHESRSNACC